MASPSDITFRPQLWQAPLFWVLSAFFGALWLAAQQVYAPVDVSCQRRGNQTSCQLITQQWPTPQVIQLSQRELADASFEVVPLAQDRSYKKVELRSGDSTRLLADFSSDVRRQEVGALNDFLNDPSSGTVSARIVAPSSSGSGPLFLLLLGMATFVGGLFSLARQTSFSVTGEQLEVRARRWPLTPLVQHIGRSEIAEVVVVSRIPDRLASIVGSLPWRGVYRASALAVSLTNGEERLLSDWSKRTRALHEHTAAALRERLSPQPGISTG